MSDSTDHSSCCQLSISSSSPDFDREHDFQREKSFILCRYELMMYGARDEDSGEFTCTTPRERKNSIIVKVKGEIVAHACIQHANKIRRPRTNFGDPPTWADEV